LICIGVSKSGSGRGDYAESGLGTLPGSLKKPIPLRSYV